ncbi:MAG: GTP cyclohydrolase FolE2 [Pseudomonadota bacterium]
MRQIPVGFTREDLQAQKAAEKDFGRLNWVGMSGLQVPVRFAHPDLKSVSAMAKSDAFVSLDRSDQRGIHMSRVYQALEQEFLREGCWSDSSLKDFGKRLLSTQEGAARNFRVNLELELPLSRKALVSQGSGWRSYPLSIHLLGSSDSVAVGLSSEILYSSTCPCSAGLARELNYEAFQKHFEGKDTLSMSEALGFMKSKEALAGTPHAQRSRAQWTVHLNSGFENLIGIAAEQIESLEKSLATPVQTLVKREDEKEFARLNAENLMFCEDAARRARDHFQAQSLIQAFECKVIHEESLHPHNAVAVIAEGQMPSFK